MRAAIFVALMSLAASWPACQLNNPAPVEPTYPPPVPFETKDAGHE